MGRKAYFMILKCAVEFLDDKDICPWNESVSICAATDTNITHLIQPITEAKLDDQEFINSVKSFCNNYSLEQAFLNIEVSQKRALSKPDEGTE